MSGNEQAIGRWAGQKWGRTKSLRVDEHNEQVAVITWWAYACKRYGIDERLLFAVPNAGAGASKGQAGKMKGEGTRVGIPDLVLAVARRGHHGLYIEMKAMDGTLRPSQAKVHELLRAQGYRVETCKGSQAAMLVLAEYLRT